MTLNPQKWVVIRNQVCQDSLKNKIKKSLRILIIGYRVFFPLTWGHMLHNGHTRFEYHCNPNDI